MAPSTGSLAPEDKPTRSQPQGVAASAASLGWEAQSAPGARLGGSPERAPPPYWIGEGPGHPSSTLCGKQ